MATVVGEQEKKRLVFNYERTLGRQFFIGIFFFLKFSSRLWYLKRCITASIYFYGIWQAYLGKISGSKEKKIVDYFNFTVT